MYDTYKQIENGLYMAKVLDPKQRQMIAGISIEAGYHPVIGKIEYECYSDDPIFDEHQEIIDQYIEGLYGVIEELRLLREKREGQTLLCCRVRCQTDAAKEVRDTFIHPQLDLSGFPRMKSGDSFCHVVLSSEKEEANRIIEEILKDHHAELTWTFAEIV